MAGGCLCLEFRIINKTDLELNEYHRMRHTLWPKHTEDDLFREMMMIIEGKTFYKNELSWTTFVVVRDNGKIGGFIEITQYSELDFCNSKPVGFIEGWYVDEDLRNQGVGMQLVETAENWLKINGCTEIASDVEEDNVISQKAHRALGFHESHKKDGCFFYKKPL